MSKLLTVRNTPLTIASNLFIVESEIDRLEKRKKELRDQLMEKLKDQGVVSVRLENGIQYIRSQRHSLKILDAKKAVAWGSENIEARMKLDSSAALKALKLDKSLKKIFGSITTEYLTIKKTLAN